MAEKPPKSEILRFFACEKFKCTPWPHTSSDSAEIFSDYRGTDCATFDAYLAAIDGQDDELRPFSWWPSNFEDPTLGRF